MSDQIFGGGGGGGAAWGDLTGTLADQTDLQTALDAKAPLASPTFSGTTTFPDGTTVTSAGINIGQYAGAGDTINLGNTRLSTETGNSDRQQASLPSGGRYNIVENGQQVLTASAESANWGAFAASRDWTMQWQMGKGTSVYGKGKVRGYGSSTAGSSATVEADLITKTTQANLLANNDERMTVYAWGTTGANGNAKNIKLYFGGTAIGTIATSANAKVWSIRSEVIRTGASAQKYVVEMNIDGTLTIVSGTLAISTTATIIVKVTGDEVVTCEALHIDYDRAGN